MYGALMNANGSCSFEGFAADVALMWPFVRMNLTMEHQLGIIFEHFATSVARILCQMGKAVDTIVVHGSAYLHEKIQFEISRFYWFISLFKLQEETILNNECR